MPELHTAADGPVDGHAAPHDDVTALVEEHISVVEPEDALPRVSLDELPEAMRAACARAGWTNLMPVQSLALPYLMAGRDIMVQSRTGSGKTGTYLLPLLPRLDAETKAPQALVLVPTRELAVQVEHEARTLFAETGIRPAAVYGGVGYKKQMDALRDGAQLIVGTPGRVLDHLLRRTLNLEALRMLVFDEADRMLSIGFYPDMKEVQRYLPRRRVHTCMFSATYPPHVLRLAGEFMADPAMLSLSRKEVHVAEVQHLFCACRPMDKDRVLVRLLETENPASAIIFCNTKANVHYVTSVLQGFGYCADELSADLSQNRREAVLDKIRRGALQYLVATDVAARGIDIPALSHVFLYEPPEDHESYIHRAGRTGRAGAAGTVISLVDVMQRMELERIARHFKIALRELPAPTDDDVAAVAGTRLTALLEARFRKLNGLERLRVARYVPLVRALAAQDEGGDGELMLAMLLDACHQQSLRESRFPEGLPEPRENGGKAGRSRRKRSARREDGGAEEREAAPAESVPQSGADGGDGHDGSGTDGEGRSARRRSGRRRRGRGRREQDGEAMQPGAADAGDET
ncbi:MAG TPA: DEAD/DEAH box helicase [Candidatus Desulfovibrio intestinavium]|uniref:DEAD/DEAH box helicase n=1 Tax=Candidatus Desulfovibrio intestinavium TaxID=2838534 RepID=A0A9D2HLT8_9BACT|nr:DEAD/DEAH box helicase [Candidatus Desulfovibrio intestinavium]